MSILNARFARGCVAALVAAAALLGAAPAEEARAGEAKIACGKPTFTSSDGLSATAGVPITFKATGSFVPPEKDGEPWLIFTFDFGDGSFGVSQKVFGSGTLKGEVQHTYTTAGDFKVKVSSHHGADLFGYRFNSSLRSISLRVDCEGRSVGPAKIPRGTFDAFGGTWTQIPGKGLVTQLALTTEGDRVKGSMAFTDPDGKPYAGLIDAPIKGFTNKKGSALTVDATVGGASIQLYLITGAEFTQSYREMGFLLRHPSGGLDLISSLQLASRDANVVAALNTSISAGKKSVKPGQKLAFVADIGNEGLACLPAERVVLLIEVTGAQIQEQTDSVRMVDHSIHGQTAAFTVGALGEGNAKTGVARATIVVIPDAAAKEVEFKVSVLDIGAALDPFFQVQAPPNRQLCVPVVQPNPASR